MADPAAAMAATPPAPGAPTPLPLEQQGALAEADNRVSALLRQLYEVMPVYGTHGGDPQKKAAVLKAITALDGAFKTSEPQQGHAAMAPQMAAAIERGAAAQQPPASAEPPPA